MKTRSRSVECELKILENIYRFSQWRERESLSVSESRNKNNFHSQNKDDDDDNEVKSDAGNARAQGREQYRKE